ncbi:hypothetical protein C8R43DRAFT_1233519, partial [Mycena crocata]
LRVSETKAVNVQALERSSRRTALSVDCAWANLLAISGDFFFVLGLSGAFVPSFGISVLAAQTLTYREKTWNRQDLKYFASSLWPNYFSRLALSYSSNRVHLQYYLDSLRGGNNNLLLLIILVASESQHALTFSQTSSYESISP